MNIVGSMILVVAALALLFVAFLRGYKPFAGPARGADLVGAPSTSVRTLEMERKESVGSMDDKNIALLVGSVACFVCALLLTIL